VVLAVVVADLLARLDLPAGADLDLMADKIDLGVWPAGVIDVARGVLARLAIDGPTVVQLKEILVLRAVVSFGPV
jgi:hypothetical protein